ncbi:hypothetical protein CPV29_23870 [Salmonella enterica]|nr:hypothetical protein [Salmonella enterica]EBJ4770273.1 hypothetical protein [Salmonella enterica]
MDKKNQSGQNWSDTQSQVGIKAAFVFELILFEMMMTMVPGASRGAPARSGPERILLFTTR